MTVRAAVERPESYLSFLPPSSETWHALLLPIGFRGVCNYINGSGLTFATEAPDPGGPLFIVTSGGFNVEPDFDHARLVSR